MKKVLFCFTAVLFLTGCATASNYVWYNPNKTNNDEVQQEAYDCEYRAKTLAYQASAPYATGGSPGIGGGMAEGMMSGIVQGTTLSKEYSRCMQAKGYTLRLKNELNSQSKQEEVKK